MPNGLVAVRQVVVNDDNFYFLLNFLNIIMQLSNKNSTIPAWHNLLAYPDFAIDALHRTSLFWQIEATHPFYVAKQLDNHQGISLSNAYHQPVILQNGTLGNRLFLKENKTYTFYITYQSPIKLIVGLYTVDEHNPLIFWRLNPNDTLTTWQQTFTLSQTIERKSLQIKILVGDTQLEEVVIQSIAIIDNEPIDLPKIMVGIVTYNRRNYITTLLKQISQLVYPNEKIQVVVVDNASTDGSAELLAAEYPSVIVLRNHENLGGSGGFNTFFNYIQQLENPTTLAWLIDDDAQIDGYTLLNLVRAIQTDDEIAIAGSVMMDLENPTFAYEAGGHLYADQFGWQANLLKAELHQLNHIKDRLWKVGYAGAYSLLFKTEILAKAGIWHNYFLHVDDSEWCYRVQRTTGKKVVITLDSLIWHVLQGSRKPFTTLRYYETRNFLNYFAWYADKKVVAKVLLQCVRFAIRQLVIKRRDLCQFHLAGIHDFFDAHYGKQNLTRQCKIVADVKGIIDDYMQIKQRNPKIIFLVTEINDYVNDGVDYETLIIQAIRQYSPVSKIIITGFNITNVMVQQADIANNLSYHRNKYIRILQQLWKIAFHRQGIVILPFWNESIVANNLATLTAVYENGSYSLYWTQRFNLLTSLTKMSVQIIKWLAKTLFNKYNPSAAKANNI